MLLVNSEMKMLFSVFSVSSVVKVLISLGDETKYCGIQALFFSAIFACFFLCALCDKSFLLLAKNKMEVRSSVISVFSVFKRFGFQQN